jgi:hypothetical protein
MSASNSATSIVSALLNELGRELGHPDTRRETHQLRPAQPGTRVEQRWGVYCFVGGCYFQGRATATSAAEARFLADVHDRMAHGGGHSAEAYMAEVVVTAHPSATGTGNGATGSEITAQSGLSTGGGGRR